MNDDGEGYSVTGIGACTDTDIVIPSTYNDLPVTSIGNSAFYCCSALTDVYYTGTEEKWATITIGSSNTNLTKATIHYNWTGTNPN